MGGRLDTPHFHEAQVLVVAAAGNSATDPCRTYYDPVTTPDKLLVGATTKEGALASFSNFGACVHVQVLLPSRPVAHNPAPFPPVHVHVFLPAAAHPRARLPPAFTLPPRPQLRRRCRTEPPPRVCPGPRPIHPGGVGWLKQRRH